MPVPTAPTAVPTATATVGKPALLEIGAPLRVSLPGVTADVVASGPVQSTEASGGASPPRETAGTFTIRVAPTSGSVTVRTADFSSLNEVGHPVRLTPVGPAGVTARAGRPASLALRGTYGSGAAQITWRHGGAVIAIWDFTIELD